MKQLITLSILLLAGPSLASAQTFDVTSGSTVLHPTDEFSTFTVAGPCSSRGIWRRATCHTLFCRGRYRFHHSDQRLSDPAWRSLGAPR
jgi:hypothetical protein